MDRNVACTAIVVALLSRVLLWLLGILWATNSLNRSFGQPKTRWGPFSLCATLPLPFAVGIPTSFCPWHASCRPECLRGGSLVVPTGRGGPTALPPGSPVVARFGSRVSLCAEASLRELPGFPGPCVVLVWRRPWRVRLRRPALAAFELLHAVALQGRRMRFPALEFYLYRLGCALCSLGGWPHCPRLAGPGLCTRLVGPGLRTRLRCLRRVVSLAARLRHLVSVLARLRCPRHVVSVLARRGVSFCVSTRFGSSQSPSRSASMYRLAVCMGFVALCGGPARHFSRTGARMSHRCAPWWLLPRRAGNCDCLYRVTIAYIGLHLCRELHLSMVVLCLWWCICLWWYHICVLVYAETAVAPAKMRYSICRPGVFAYMDNWGSSVCRPGVFCVHGQLGFECM